MLEYKIDFLIGILGFFFTQLFGIIFIVLVFNYIPTLNGWSFYQVMYIYGFSQIPRGIDHLISDNLWALSNKIIVRGEFDRYLLRPLNTLFQVVAEVFQLDALGEILIGIIIVIISSMELNINYNLINILIFTFTILSGAVIYFSIKVIFASFAFWIKKSFSILSIVYSLSDFVKYPINIYSYSIQMILTVVIPFGFTAYFPASYFIGNNSIFYGCILTIFIAIIFLGIACKVWVIGINNYESSGN